MSKRKYCPKCGCKHDTHSFIRIVDGYLMIRTCKTSGDIQYRCIRGNHHNMQDEHRCEDCHGKFTCHGSFYDYGLTRKR